MSSDTPKDEALDRLLQEIAKNLDENQRFMRALKDERLDMEPDDKATEHEEEAEESFEEL